MDWWVEVRVETLEEAEWATGVAMYQEVVMDWLAGGGVETLEEAECVTGVAM
jgi:uncharacterized membrane protein (DUF441 family)